MNEIEFRGKRLSDGQWVYGYYYQDCETGRHIIHLKKVDGIFTGYDVDQKTVGQYLWCTDQKGKRVYAGDIVEFDKYEWYRSPVRTKAQIAKLPRRFEEITFSSEGISRSMSDLKTYCKVVGTKFDNPELLKIN
jgi:hypothetical protein